MKKWLCVVVALSYFDSYGMLIPPDSNGDMVQSKKIDDFKQYMIADDIQKYEKELAAPIFVQISYPTILNLIEEHGLWINCVRSILMEQINHRVADSKTYFLARHFFGFY
ncbi:MAG: hypothetical protein LBQ08_02480 [Holosporaceae bacterium]|jgi:hypothetical protein|nr:hypothetical protein [Holosporaceae bacterium]